MNLKKSLVYITEIRTHKIRLIQLNSKVVIWTVTNSLHVHFSSEPLTITVLIVYNYIRHFRLATATDVTVA